jgi:DNA-binding GntR family transcriptional regulator
MRHSDVYTYLRISARTTARTVNRVPRISGTGPVFRRIADDLKARIEAGEFRPGSQLPREDTLARSYGVARATVRHAITVLEYDRILEVRHGHGTFVRQHVPPEFVDLERGQQVTARMPTLEQQQELDIAATTPVLVVLDADGAAGMAYPADRVMLRCP